MPISKAALLYVNPRARTGQNGKAAALTTLSNAGIPVIDASQVPLASLARFARKHRGQIDRVVVGGGDGTINQLLETLLAIRLPVGLLPLGTANDLSVTLGIPQSLSGASAVIAKGAQRRIDLGWVNGKHYVNDGSIGVTTRISRGLQPAAKERFGVFAIAAEAARALSRPRRFHARIRNEGTVADVCTYQITVGNGKRFGGLLTSADADVTDHRLELYSLELERLADITTLLPALARGHFGEAPSVRVLSGQRFRVTTDRPRPVFTDGERTTLTPAVFKVVPAALTVFAPRH